MLFEITHGQIKGNEMALNNLNIEQSSDWLNQLSVEIIERILLFLNPKDVLIMGKCCIRLRDITKNELIWTKLVKRDYGIDIRRSPNPNEKSVRVLYSNILEKYGRLLSTLFIRKNFTYYGGIIKVVYHDFALYVLDLEPPPFPHVLEGLQPHILCKISSNSCDDDEKVILEQETTDFGKIDHIEVISVGLNDKLSPFRIISTPSSLPFMKDLRGHIASYFEDSTSNGIPEGLILHQKFAKRFGLMHNMALEKLEDRIEYLNQGVQVCEALSFDRNIALPPFSPIPPGVFKGTYGPHGIEIINVEYKSEPSVEHRCELTMVGNKLYGDRNVPFNQLTFKAYLNKPMTLSNDTQASIKKIQDYMDKSEESSLPTQVTSPSIQPFILPNECECECSLDDNVFHKSVWRFQASCQIASDMYQNPEWIDGNLVIFSDDLFGVIFMAEAHGFNSLTIYHRLKEDLSAVHYDDVFKDLPLNEISDKFA